MWEDVRNNCAVSGLLGLGVCLLVGLAAAKYIAPEGWGPATMAAASIIGVVLGVVIYRRKPLSLAAVALRERVHQSSRSSDTHGEILKTALDLLRQYALDETIEQMNVAVLADPHNRILGISLAGLLLEKERRQKRIGRFREASSTRSAAEALLDRYGENDLLRTGNRKSDDTKARIAEGGLTTSDSTVDAAGSQQRRTRLLIESHAHHVGPAILAVVDRAASEWKGRLRIARSTWLLIGGCAIVLAISFALLTSVLRKKGSVPGSEPRINFQIAPETAAIEVDGARVAGSSIALGEGIHHIRIQSEGYEPVEDILTVGSGQATYAKKLVPSDLLLEFETNFEKTAALLDGNPLTSAARISPDRNEHRLIVHFPGKEIPISFTARPVALPNLQPLPPERTFPMIVVASFADQAVVYTGRTGVSVSIGDRREGPASADGLPVSLRATDTDPVLTIEEGDQRQEIRISRADPPRLRVLAVREERLEPPDGSITGSILATADQNDAQVLIDGQRAKGSISRGRLVVAHIQPGTHRVMVSKDGFCSIPRELSLKLTGSEQVRAPFKLQRIPSLRFIGMPQGARVFVDGVELSNRPITISPAEHLIKVIAPGFSDFSETLDPSCGNDVTLDIGSEMLPAERVPEVPTKARLTFVAEPAGASLKLLHPDGTPVVDGPVTSPLELQPGVYRLHGSLPGYEDADVQFTAQAGENFPGVFLRLVAIRKPEIRSPGRELWSPPLSEERQGWARAMDISLYGEANASGTYMFRIRKRGSLRKKFFGSWVIDYRSPSDYLEFRIEGKDLQWRRAGTSAWTKIDSIEFPRERNDIYLRIDVRSTTVSTALGISAETAYQVGKPLSISGGRFGLTKDTEIADLRHVN